MVRLVCSPGKKGLSLLNSMVVMTSFGSATVSNRHTTEVDIVAVMGGYKVAIQILQYISHGIFVCHQESEAVADFGREWWRPT